MDPLALVGPRHLPGTARSPPYLGDVLLLPPRSGSGMKLIARPEHDQVSVVLELRQLGVGPEGEAVKMRFDGRHLPAAHVTSAKRVLGLTARAPACEQDRSAVLAIEQLVEAS